MSQPVAKPHVVKVYGAHSAEKCPEVTFGLLERKECDSKTSARRYASEARKRPEVTSATVEPL